MIQDIESQCAQFQGKHLGDLMLSDIAYIVGLLHKYGMHNMEMDQLLMSAYTRLLFKSLKRFIYHRMFMHLLSN